jgi:hypothetical protein
MAAATTLMLDGSLYVFEQKPDSNKAGRFLQPNEIHIEGGDDAGVVVYFSMRGKDDHTYDLLNPDFSLSRAITVQDVAKD